MAYPDIQSIDNFLFLPLNQIKNYSDFLKKCCNFGPNNQSARARMAYDLVHSFGKRIQENYELYKVKKSKISINKPNSGLVLYSDSVIAKSNESFRIFVMEKALACCSIANVNEKVSNNGVYSINHLWMCCDNLYFDRKRIPVYFSITSTNKSRSSRA